MKCPHDTDNDGDCHLCHNCGGCNFVMQGLPVQPRAATAREAIDLLASGTDGGITVLDGWDEALLGVSHALDTPRAVYSETLILMHLMGRDGMTGDEALEFFDFNIAGACSPDRGPIFVSQPHLILRLK